MEISDKEYLAPGHRGCAGCGASIGVRLALNALGKNTVAISATGCLEVMTSLTQKPLGNSMDACSFENAGAGASGVESALRIQGKDDVNVVALGENGGTVDIRYNSYPRSNGKRTQLNLHLLR